MLSQLARVQPKFVVATVEVSSMPNTLICSQSVHLQTHAFAGNLVMLVSTQGASCHLGVLSTCSAVCQKGVQLLLVDLCVLRCSCCLGSCFVICSCEGCLQLCSLLSEVLDSQGVLCGLQEGQGGLKLD